MPDTDTTPAGLTANAEAHSLAEAERLRQATVVVPIDTVRPHPDNPRRGDVEALRGSVAEHGLYRTVVVQKSTGHLLAGNHTWAAAKAEGRTHLAVIEHDCDDDEARRILIADNGYNRLGGYDDTKLAELLQGLEHTDRGLAGTSYDSSGLADLLEGITSEHLDLLPAGSEWDGEGAGDGGDADPDTSTGGDVPDPTAGTLLALADVTVAEPTHSPTHGTRWRLDGRHLLVIARLSDEHHLWRDELEGRVFAPYPEPYMTVSTLAAEEPLLLVQPNRYLAGHLLDKHAAFFGADSVEQLT